MPEPYRRDILNAKLAEAKAERKRIAEEIARIEEADQGQIEVEEAVAGVREEIQRFRTLLELGGESAGRGDADPRRPGRPRPSPAPARAGPRTRTCWTLNTRRRECRLNVRPGASTSMPKV